MSYYAAGGYYRAGSFWSKLKTGIHKFSTFASSNPIMSGIVGLIPGASTALAGLSVADQVFSTVGAAVGGSTHGTPGANARAAQLGLHHQAFGGRRRGRGRGSRRLRRARAY
jgi:hypothetical protein